VAFVGLASLPPAGHGLNACETKQTKRASAAVELLTGHAMAEAAVELLVDVRLGSSTESLPDLAPLGAVALPALGALRGLDAIRVVIVVGQ
jgi:hypothetical protein